MTPLSRISLSFRSKGRERSRHSKILMKWTWCKNEWVDISLTKIEPWLKLHSKRHNKDRHSRTKIIKMFTRLRYREDCSLIQAIQDQDLPLETTASHLCLGVQPGIYNRCSSPWCWAYLRAISQRTIQQPSTHLPRASSRIWLSWADRYVRIVHLNGALVRMSPVNFP